MYDREGDHIWLKLQIENLQVYLELNLLNLLEK